MGTLGWRLLGTAAALAAGAVATKVVGVGWRAVSGREAPTDPAEVDETSWGEALVYAAILGLAVGAAPTLLPPPAGEPVERIRRPRHVPSRSRNTASSPKRCEVTAGFTRNRRRPSADELLVDSILVPE